MILNNSQSWYRSLRTVENRRMPDDRPNPIRDDLVIEQIMDFQTSFEFLQNYEFQWKFTVFTNIFLSNNLGELM